MRMLRPITIAMADGSQVIVDGEVVLKDALDLLKRLYEAGDMYRDGDRQSVMAVLSQLQRFARCLDMWSRVSASVVPTATMIALEDLDRGFTPNLFRKAKPRRVARQSRREWYMKACAAGCLEVLIASGIDDDEAKSYIARILSRTTFKMGRVATASANVVADWRKRFRENDNVAPEDLEAYWHTVNGQRADLNEPSHALKERIELLLLNMLRLNGFEKKGG
ncbi:MAG: hypothetical protein AB7O95_26505 [Geminicoccaceae bacterium]